MTTQPQDPQSGSSAAEKQASQFTKPLREPIALVLLGVTAILLFLALVGLIPVGYDGPLGRYVDFIGGRFGDFVNTLTIGLPLLAVLLATHVLPMVPRAKLITLAALALYAVAAFFGVIFGLLLGFAADLSDEGLNLTVTEGSWRGALESALGRLAILALLAIAGFVVFRVWQGMFYVPRPKPVPVQPGVYGQPTYPGYPQQYGQPYPPQQQYGQPYPQQTVYGQPAGYPAQQPAQPTAPVGYQQPYGAPAGGGWPTPSYPPVPPPQPTPAQPQPTPAQPQPTPAQPTQTSAPPSSAPATSGPPVNDAPTVVTPVQPPPTVQAPPPPPSPVPQQAPPEPAQPSDEPTTSVSTPDEENQRTQVIRDDDATRPWSP